MPESNRASAGATGQTHRVRAAAVAGAFYPARPDVLAATVSGLLAAGPRGEQRGVVRAIIVPHAGYVYSGPIAASAFAILRDGSSRPRRVVIIGPSHFFGFSGLAAPGAGAFATPLGDMPLDSGAIENITPMPQVVITDEPHTPEHAIEVELPFLRVVLGAVPIVPLLVGRATAEEVAEVLDRLWDDATLVVVSSDLSHYLSYEAAREQDAATAAALESFDGSRIGLNDACGALPLRGLLLAAKHRGLTIQRLDLRNSADTAGGRRRVVGYGAWVLHGRTPLAA